MDFVPWTFSASRDQPLPALLSNSTSTDAHVLCPLFLALLWIITPNHKSALFHRRCDFSSLRFLHHRKAGASIAAAIFLSVTELTPPPPPTYRTASLLATLVLC